MPSFVEDYAAQVRKLGAHADKQIINSLTKIADQVRSGNDRLKGKPEDIVGIIEKNLLRSPPKHKLPLVYLMDSILYNVRGVYHQLFARNLIKIFQAVYAEAPSSSKAKMLKMLSRWGDRKGSASFDPALLLQIRARCDPEYKGTHYSMLPMPVVNPQPTPKSRQPSPPPAPVYGNYPPNMTAPPQPGFPAPANNNGFYNNSPPPLQQQPQQLTPMSFPPAMQPGQPPNMMAQPNMPVSPLQPATGMGGPGYTPQQLQGKAASILAELLAQVQANVPPQQRMTLDRLQVENPVLHNQIYTRAHAELASQAASTLQFPTLQLSPQDTQRISDANLGSTMLSVDELNRFTMIAQQSILTPDGQKLWGVVNQIRGRQPSGPDFTPASLNDENKARMFVAQMLGLGSPFGQVHDATSGLSFDTQAQMVSYNEKQFAMKRRRMAQSRGNSGPTSRSWYLSQDDWVKSIDDATDKMASLLTKPGAGNSHASSSAQVSGGALSQSGSTKTSVLADESQKNCALSGDPFESYWDDDEEEWMYRNAIRPDPNGPIYLIKAWEAVQKKRPAQGDLSAEAKKPKL